MQGKLIALCSLLTLLLTGAACNLVITPAAPTSELNPNGVIFTPNQVEANLDIINPQAEGIWTPAADDITKLEANLIPYLTTAENRWFRNDPPIGERVPDYIRQYLGIVENGEEVIFANFFCTAGQTDWQIQYVFVLDGGDCYFQVKYNPQTGRFFDLSVNGES